MKTEDCDLDHRQCINQYLPLRDSIEVLGPKWRIQILVAVRYGHENFTHIQQALSPISARVLSKELKVLEENGLISREVTEDYPVSIKYKWTEHTETIAPIMEMLQDWGKLHRSHLFKVSG